MKVTSIWPQLKELIEVTAKEVREKRVNMLPDAFESKADDSLVTKIDKETEERLISGMVKILPESVFLAEEAHNKTEEDGYTWIIDPIDGTTNLVHNVPAYCISIALRYNGKTILGVVYEINRKEMFYAIEDEEGAYLNDMVIRVSETHTLNKSLIGTGFPASAFDKLDEYLVHFRYFMQHTHGIRRVGSAALDLAYVACGRYDGFFEYNLSPWDVAGGAYIVQKAGGLVTDFSGGEDFIYGRRIIASNSAIHVEMLNQLKK
jgi:myo-inositol-1(or 4)-monophosphatase